MGRFIHIEDIKDIACYNARVIAYNQSTRMHLVVYDYTGLFITDEFTLLDIPQLWHHAEDTVSLIRHQDH